mmetsp:Transcript_13066/g.13187  ORF Transcript_13066/g.13187 Transcript_13066/m.13187 type:complete len:231 (+) Transcript_13066:54-746(+)
MSYPRDYSNLYLDTNQYNSKDPYSSIPKYSYSTRNSSYPYSDLHSNFYPSKYPIYEPYKPIFEDKQDYHSRIERNIDQQIEEKETRLKKFSSTETSFSKSNYPDNPDFQSSRNNFRAESQSDSKQESSLKLSRSNSSKKYDHMRNPYSKYNTISPYAKTTFAYRMRTIDNQPYTFSEEEPVIKKNEKRVVKTSQKNKVIKRLVGIIEDHAEICPQLKYKLDALREEFPFI